MLSRVRISTLMAVAGGCGIAIGTMVILLRKESESKANKSTVVKTALDIAKSQRVVIELLGDKIVAGSVSLVDGWSKIDQDKAKLMIPIHGEKDGGYLFIHARRKDDEARMKLHKIEMTFNTIAGRKLVVLDTDKKETSG